MVMKKTTIVFSINVHENLNFLIKQIKDIEDNVLLDYVIIINANQYMFNAIVNSTLLYVKANIELYPVYLDKIHAHGSLTKGIYLNMKHAIKNYQFEYFVILSSRNLFYNKLHQGNYKNMLKICEGVSYSKLNKDVWAWPMFLKTKLSQYVINNNLLFSTTSVHHEGLTFDYESAVKIVEFFESHEDIRDEIFNFQGSVEEFALQCISLNLSGHYYNIGNWTSNDDSLNIHNLPSNRFVYKAYRR